MLTDTFLHILYTVVRWRFFLLPVFIVAPLIIASPRLVGPKVGCFGCLGSVIAIPFSIILGIANVIAGPDLSALVIHRFGVQGEATVTGTYNTGSSYNDRQVMGHRVLIKTADGQTIETSFEDDDFNVYPPANGVYYPGDSDIFNVSYIKSYPQDFIIISDDDSPWARGLRCFGLMSALHEAHNKQQFATNAQAYRKAFEDALRAAQAAGCDTSGDN